MRKVIFPLVKDGSRIVYPDNIALFANTRIEGENIIADYAGTDGTIADYVYAESDHVFLTHLAFRRLFTLAERVAFDNFESNPALTDEYKAQLRTLMKDMELARELDLKDPDLILGVNTIEALGIIGPGRAAEVLAYRP